MAILVGINRSMAWVICAVVLALLGWRMLSASPSANQTLESFAQVYKCSACAHQFEMTPPEARAWAKDKPSIASPEQSRKFTCPACAAVAVIYYEEPIP